MKAKFDESSSQCFNLREKELEDSLTLPRYARFFPFVCFSLHDLNNFQWRLRNEDFFKFPPIFFNIDIDDSSLKKEDEL